MAVGPERADEVVAVLALLTEWARRQPDVRALALVGSWARGAQQETSDVDVVLLTDAPERYVDADDWLAQVGGVRLLTTRRWGPLTERRFARPSGLEVEVGVATPAWASTDPVDDGTRSVVIDGLRPLLDPGGLLAALVSACAQVRPGSPGCSS